MTQKLTNNVIVHPVSDKPGMRMWFVTMAAGSVMTLALQGSPNDDQAALGNYTNIATIADTDLNADGVAVKTVWTFPTMRQVRLAFTSGTSQTWLIE